MLLCVTYTLCYSVFTYTFLVEPPPCPPTSLLINHIFSWKSKLKHTGVDITCLFSECKILTKHKASYGTSQTSVLELFTSQRKQFLQKVLPLNFERVLNIINFYIGESYSPPNYGAMA